ncbi:hypothetical protein HKX48_007338 [Thoreauomyces humboldtii]|nr:hypothetical protein HKX48_007338 [Thoreauomyces humboldtii]
MPHGRRADDNCPRLKSLKPVPSAWLTATRLDPSFRGVTREGASIHPVASSSTLVKVLVRKRTEPHDPVSGLLKKVQTKTNLFKKVVARVESSRSSVPMQSPPPQNQKQPLSFGGQSGKRTCHRKRCSPLSTGLQTFCGEHSRQFMSILRELSEAISRNSRADIDLWMQKKAEFLKLVPAVSATRSTRTARDMHIGGEHQLPITPSCDLVARIQARIQAGHPVVSGDHQVPISPSPDLVARIQARDSVVFAPDPISTSGSAREESAFTPWHRTPLDPVDSTPIVRIACQEVVQHQNVAASASRLVDYVMVEDESGRFHEAPRAVAVEVTTDHSFPRNVIPLPIEHIEQQQQVCVAPIVISVPVASDHPKQLERPIRGTWVTGNNMAAGPTLKKATPFTPPQLQHQLSHLFKTKQEVGGFAASSLTKTREVQCLLVENEDGDFIEVEVLI